MPRKVAFPEILENAHVRLEPLVRAHGEGLARAARQSPGIFTYMPADLAGAGFDAWLDWSLAGLAKGTDWPWTVIDRQSGRIAGSTRYLNMAFEHKRAEIGYTWYAQEFWGGVVNPSAKCLLFEFGFEALGLNRIELKTDARNARSRAAIARLGAQEEGVFRKHMIVQGGHVRDTVHFSVIAPEWPQVRAGLNARIAAFDAPEG